MSEKMLLKGNCIPVGFTITDVASSPDVKTIAVPRPYNIELSKIKSTYVSCYDVSIVAFDDSIRWDNESIYFNCICRDWSKVKSVYLNYFSHDIEGEMQVIIDQMAELSTRLKELNQLRNK